MRAERRRRGDLVTAAALAVAALVGAGALGVTSAAAGTTSVPAAVAAPAPPPAVGVPAAFVEAWRAPSAATPVPVVVGPGVVSADGSTVTGHDAATGTPTWTYARDIPLCTAAAAFPTVDQGVGRVLALYSGGADWCSELTALRPDTGARKTTANPDARPGTRLLAAGGSVVAISADSLEVLRSDLVKTLEYGQVVAPAQPGRQPRPGCRYGSVALVPQRLGVLERCPLDGTDRLTVLVPDGSEGADQPQQEFSGTLPAGGATLVALSADRAAVTVPGPPRLLLYDRVGTLLETIPLDAAALGITDGELAADPADGTVALRSTGERLSWWTGARTVALDTATLAPLWAVPDTLGPALPYGGGLLVPVPTGLAEVDTTSGAVLRTIPVPRADPRSPVRLDSAGEVVLEQRGTDLVALRPAP